MTIDAGADKNVIRIVLCSVLPAKLHTNSDRMCACDMRRRWSDIFMAVPVASFCSMLFCWVGVLIFCVKMYHGVEVIAALSKDLFKNWEEYFELAKRVFVGVGVTMVVLTLLMAIIGMLSTRNCTRCDCGKPPSRASHWLGGRLACAIFLVLNYVTYICWLAFFTGVIVLLAAQIGFSPLCLPKSGFQNVYCFNFSLLATLTGDKPSFELALCAPVINDFCQLTQSIMPWFWYAYGGCLIVILGLTNFTACLAANFAHNKRVHIFTRTQSLASDMTDGAAKSLQPKRTRSKRKNKPSMVFSTALPPVLNGIVPKSDYRNYYHENGTVKCGEVGDDDDCIIEETVIRRKRVKRQSAHNTVAPEYDVPASITVAGEVTRLEGRQDKSKADGAVPTPFTLASDHEFHQRATVV